MANYTLIQDIEAEDKILGPLTLRQFIFALVSVFLFYLCFIMVTKHVAFLLVLFLPPALFCGFFAFPFGRDQPTEIWALAKLRFWFKPRKRVWNQSGVKELVTITVPKKVERVLTNGLSQNEVKSRLRALADTIDTRGWATKNASGGTYAQPIVGDGSDRLIGIDNLPQEVPVYEVAAADDILDETNNPIARQFETMIDRSTRTHRQQLIDQLNEVRQDGPLPQVSGSAVAPGNWFMNVGQDKVATMPANMSPAQIPAGSVPSPSDGMPAAPAATAADMADEAVLSASLAAQANSSQASFGNLRTVQPLGTATVPPPVQPDSSANPVDPATASSQTPNQTGAALGNDAVTATTDPDILYLAKNDDLNVATLAREAHKKKGDETRSGNEVVISLH